MKEASGEANLTVVAIILIAVVVAVATPLVSSLMTTATYRSCCTNAGGVWRNGFCTAQTPISCEDREAVWSEYDSCALENDANRANEHYRAVSCS